MTHLPENLRFLCGFYASISEVCRRVGINRSQFNKYLAGATRPSPYAMRRICNFFGVEEHEIYLPPKQFAERMDLRPQRSVPTSDIAHVKHLSTLQLISDPVMGDYEGAYFEYYLSMTYPGYIIRSFMQLKYTKDGTYYKRIERLNPSHLSERRFRCVYRGIAYYLAGRIFMIDYESLSKTEISETILFPSYKSRITYLNGLKLGVSADNRHAPVATRVVLEYLGRSVNQKKALALSGLFPLSSDQISREIKQRIQNAIDGESGNLKP